MIMDTTKPKEEKPAELILEANGPDTAAKKKKKNKNRKKKVLLDIGAGEFVPTFNFSVDPVADPIATPKKDVLLPVQQSEESSKVKPKKLKVKISETPQVIELSKEEVKPKPDNEATKHKKKSNRKKKDTTFNIDAPVFTPSFNPEVLAAPIKTEVQLPRAFASLDEDFGGY